MRSAFELMTEVSKFDPNLVKSERKQGEMLLYSVQRLANDAMNGKLDFSSLKDGLENVPGIDGFYKRSPAFKDAYNNFIRAQTPQENQNAVQEFITQLNHDAREQFPARTLLSGALVSTYATYATPGVGTVDDKSIPSAEIMEQLVGGVKDPSKRATIMTMPLNRYHSCNEGSY